MKTTPISSPMINIGPRVMAMSFCGPRDAIVVDAPWFKSEKIIPPGIGDS